MIRYLFFSVKKIKRIPSFFPFCLLPVGGFIDADVRPPPELVRPYTFPLCAYNPLAG